MCDTCGDVNHKEDKVEAMENMDCSCESGKCICEPKTEVVDENCLTCGKKCKGNCAVEEYKEELAA